MTEFLFVRHGEALTNTTPELVGRQSNASPLTERGRQQALELGNYLRTLDTPPSIAFSSGAVRADHTARIALRQAGFTLPLHADARLLEVSQGIFEGIHRSLVYTTENIQRYAIDSPDGKFPEGESLHDAQRRMRTFIEETHESYPDDTVLAFSHGFAIRALAGALRNFTKDEILADVTGNVSLTAIDMVDGNATVRFVGKRTIPEYT